MEDRTRIRRYTIGDLATNCYLVWSPATRQAAVIDPGGDVSAILAEIEHGGLALVMVVNTHGHGDHIIGNARLLEATGATLAIGAADAPMLTDPAQNLSIWLGEPIISPEPGRLLRHGEAILLGDLRFTVRETPGHTPGGISLVGEGVAFTGDTLMAGGIGRTDLPGGNEAALLASIARELLSLPDCTVVHPGHGESTTIGRERTGNPFLI